VEALSGCSGGTAGSIQDDGELYLPKLNEQADYAYKSYKGRALYYNATGRTVDC